MILYKKYIIEIIEVKRSISRLLKWSTLMQETRTLFLHDPFLEFNIIKDFKKEPGKIGGKSGFSSNFPPRFALLFLSLFLY